MDEDIFHGFTTIARNDPERRKFINRLLHQAREEEHEDELCDEAIKEIEDYEEFAEFEDKGDETHQSKEFPSAFSQRRREYLKKIRK